jgi:hypothetical protein
MARVIILPREKSGFDPRQAIIAAISASRRDNRGAIFMDGVKKGYSLF